MSNKALIGTIRNTRMHYYDVKARCVAFKARPVLVVGIEKEEGATDLTVLPVSKISDSRRIIEETDIKIDSSVYPLCHLTASICYVRASKVTTVHSSDTAADAICDLKTCYPELYETILATFKVFVNTL